MQSIQTKYIPPTNFRPSRIKATCERGSITVSWDYGHEAEGNHIAAADALVAKFLKEDADRYGTERNPWTHPRVCGCLKDGTYCHTFLPIEQSGKRMELCPAGTLDSVAALPAHHVLIVLANEADAATVTRALNWAAEHPDRQLQGPKLALMVSALSRSVAIRSGQNAKVSR